MSFAYQDEEVVRNFSDVFEKEKLAGILGQSGCGKSLLSKLMMCFYERNQGMISVGNRNLQDMNTSDLRDMQSFVTQDTVSSMIQLKTIFALLS